MAWLFDGVDDSLNAQLVLPADRLTVSMWVKRSAGAKGVVFETYATPSGVDRSIQIDQAGRVISRVWKQPGSLFTQSSSTLAISEWAHVLYRHGANAGGQRLVVDGVAVISPGQTQSYFAWQTHVRFAAGDYFAPSGSSDGATPFAGEIAEAAIWSEELTPAEERALAAGVTPIALPHRIDSLVLYQDLIRPLDRPGIGPAMTTVGVPVAAPHPGRLSARSFAAAWGHYPRAPAPYHAAAGCSHAAALGAGGLSVAGSESAQVALIQEG